MYRSRLGCFFFDFCRRGAGDGWQRLSSRTGDGGFLLFIIWTSSLWFLHYLMFDVECSHSSFVIRHSSFIPHSGFLIRHSLVGRGLTPRIFPYHIRYAPAGQVSALTQPEIIVIYLVMKCGTVLTGGCILYGNFV